MSAGVLEPVNNVNNLGPTLKFCDTKAPLRPRTIADRDSQVIRVEDDLSDDEDSDENDSARDDWLNEPEAASESSCLFDIEEVTNGLQELNLNAPQLSAVLSEDSPYGDRRGRV